MPVREVGRDAAVDGVEHEHRLPFLALGRMDGREDQIVLVEQRRAGLVAGGVRRIERELGQEALARADSSRRSARAAARSACAHRRVVVDALADAARTSGAPARARPASRRPRRAAAEQRRRRPASLGCRRAAARSSPSAAPDRPRSPMRSSTLRGGRRPDAGQQLQRRESRRRGRAGSRPSAAAPARP